MGVATRRTDGKAVQLVAPADIEGGDPVVIDGWHGIAVTDAADGELVAVEVEPSVHELKLVDGTVGTVGAIVYVHGDTDGGDVTLDLTATDGTKFAKIVEVDGTDSSVVFGKLLENN
jgi:predicted RecA/RadA family phage recombinase